MARVGKKPIQLSDKTKVTCEGKSLTVSGEKGSLKREIHRDIEVGIKDGMVSVTTVDQERKTLALQGLTRSLINNMVIGVEKGFERSLEINGIGYRAELKGETIVFSLGYSHPINFDLPAGILAKIDKNIITLSSIDKEALGQTAASIRKLRPPEPYKGRGIKYTDEYIQRKAGKTGAA